MKDGEVTITLRRSELRDLIVTITAMYDQSAMSFEEMQHRYPIFANGYDRLCHQAQLAGVPTNSDESIDEGIDAEADRCSSHIDCSVRVVCANTFGGSAADAHQGGAA